MSNVTTAREKIDKLVGPEPKPKDVVLDNDNIGKYLIWYANNKDSKDAQKYAKDYLTKHKLQYSLTALSSAPKQFGFICRMLTLGASLSDTTWFDEKLESIKKSDTKTEEVDVVETNKVSIQDRILAKSDAITAELEGALDVFIESGCTTSFNAMGLMVTLNTKAVNTKRILEIFRKYRVEFDAAIDTTDDYIKETYNHFSKVQLKKLVAFCDQVIRDALELGDKATATRSPRKIKSKSPEVLVSNLNYLKEFDLEGSKLVSVDPTGIIGASQVFVYNTKTKKVGVYNAEDGSGLSVKGSTISGFSVTKSVAKTLRKPEETIGELLKAGKVALRTVLSRLSTKESVLTGRLNSDTLILKIT